eukprot:gb/GECG01008560.1/.p1 GENE.gb/GECG01008560.1/~~gb/GECG01008560.1/.p1  ORF type:complete len:231 (+),score=19.58 gb/GECG01008560.1/:1-693(+)
MASQQQNLSQNRSVQDKRQRDSRQAPEVDDILKEQRTRRRPVSHVKWSEMEQNLSEEVVKFSNCWVFRDGELIWDELWVQNGVIIDPMKRFWEASNNTEFACDVVVDCEGQILSPGFIDLQLNGAYGIDISNPGVTEEQITYIAQRILRHGCTAFLPTVVTSSPSTYRHVLPKVNCLKSSSGTRVTLLANWNILKFCSSHHDAIGRMGRNTIGARFPHYRQCAPVHNPML